MRSRHLTRNGSATLFQIRLPRELDPGFRLAPIRVNLGVLPNSRARRIADILAGSAALMFERVRADPMTCDPAETRRHIEKSLAQTVPALLGLNALDGSSLSPGVHEHATEIVFDALSQIGLDKAEGRGIFAGRGIRFETPYLMALRNENAARALIGMDLAPDVLAAPIQAQLNVLKEQQERLLERLAPLLPGPKGALFSIAADKAIAQKRKTHGADHAEVGSLLYRKEIFIALVGDRPVDGYSREDLQEFANDLAWLPPNTSKRPGYDPSQLRAIINKNREEKGPGLARESIDSHLNRIKGILRQACGDASVPVGFEGRIVLPKRAAPSKARVAPAHDQVGKVVAAGVTSGIMTDALLVPLGLLTGRRIGILAHMRRENFKQYNGVWVYYPQSHERRDGEWRPIPFKTSDSLRFFVIHDIFEECGFIEWARRAPGPVFEMVMATNDPADAAQKRMGRLYDRAGVDSHSGGTFHGLRSAKIRSMREMKFDPRAVRLQVGHELGDTHEKYDAHFTDVELLALARAPLPPNVDWSLLKTIDFEVFAKRRPTGGRKKRCA